MAVTAGHTQRAHAECGRAPLAAGRHGQHDADDSRHAAPPCTVTGGEEFGNVLTTKVDGVNYR